MHMTNLLLNQTHVGGVSLTFRVRFAQILLQYYNNLTCAQNPTAEPKTETLKLKTKIKMLVNLFKMRQWLLDRSRLSESVSGLQVG